MHHLKLGPGWEVNLGSLIYAFIALHSFSESKLGNYNIQSGMNYSVYFESNWYE